MADYRISNKFYIAAEIGNDNYDQNEANLASTIKGSYFKVGADFNAYDNWTGMNNAIFTGLRYGFSTFDQTLNQFSIYTGNNTFPGTTIEENKNYNDLTAHWIEFILGVKTVVYPNLFLSLQVQLKYLVTEEVPDNFDNLYIPGFNRTYDYSEFGTGFGFGISYVIPFFRK